MGVGYAAESPRSSLLKNNQVFHSSEFRSLLDNLWLAQREGCVSKYATVFAEAHDGREFLVQRRGGRQVTILWVYLERVKAWYDQFSHDVKCELGRSTLYGTTF